MALSAGEKREELTKYRLLNLAAIDYMQAQMAISPIPGLDLQTIFAEQQKQVEEHFTKGKLNILKQWFKNLTEGSVEAKDFKINTFLKEKTGYDVDLFDAFKSRIEKIIAKGELTTHNEYYDVGIALNELCQAVPIDMVRIELLNSIVISYVDKSLQIGNSELAEEVK